jgi:hypothetical protein
MSFLDPTEEAIDRNPLPRAWVRDPRLVAIWINGVVPCLKAGVAQSGAVWKQVNQQLRSSGVSDTDVREAVRLSGQTFENLGPLLSIRVPDAGFRSDRPAPQTMGVAPTIDADYLLHQTRLLETRYISAKASGNAHDMEALARMLVDLLRLAGDWKRRRDQSDEKTANIQAEILLNARNLGAVVRPVGPRDPSPPGPDGKRVRWVGPHTFEYEVDPEALGAEEVEAKGEGDSDAE